MPPKSKKSSAAKKSPPGKKTAAEKKTVPAPEKKRKAKAVAGTPPEKAPKKTPPPSRAKADAKNALSDIVVRRDAETVQTKIITRRHGLIAYTPKELELMFRRRGADNLNLFDPDAQGKADAAHAPADKQILKELPKAKPRKIGAVSLDELFGYNPFAKDSVSAEEKLIPAKWKKYYKKLVALKAAIQKEIDEQSQTAFSREGKEESGDVSASYSQHTADIDNEAFTRDCALSLIASKQQELAEINIAVERMKKGTYGICEITGKPIPAERLRDVPFTRYSLEGQLEAEKQRAAPAPPAPPRWTRLGQGVFLHCLLGQGIAALPADLPHMERAGVVLAALLQDALDGCQAVGTDAAVGSVVDAADIPQAGVPLRIQQIGHHLSLAPVKGHLHLVELIVVLIGVHENDGKGQSAEKVDLFLAEHTQGNDAVHFLGLPKGQPDKGDLILVRHHLHQARQG